MTFSENVAVTSNDVALSNLGVDAPNDPDILIALRPEQISIDVNILTISFEPGELQDGVYSLTIRDSVSGNSGLALDEDGDGQPGGNFSFVRNDEVALFKLTADWDGDGGTAIFDFPTFSYWFGQAVPTAPEYVDLNHDGGISVFDFPEFARNFGVGITFPVTLVSQSSSETAVPLPARNEPNRQGHASSRVLEHPLDRQVTLACFARVEHRTTVGEARILRSDNELPDWDEVLDEIGAHASAAWMGLER